MKRRRLPWWGGVTAELRLVSICALLLSVASSHGSRGGRGGGDKAPPQSDDPGKEEQRTCEDFTSCRTCTQIESLGCGWCATTATCMAPDKTSVCPGMAASSCKRDGHDGGEGIMTNSTLDVCHGAPSCSTCLRRGSGCGWCASTSTCMPTESQGSCTGGWGSDVCFIACSPETTRHETAGVIEVGDMTSTFPSLYSPHQTCQFTLWPFPESSGPTARHPMQIRLQFEYVALGPRDRLEVYANGIDGQRLTTVTGDGAGVVNRIISTRSTSMVLRLVAEGDDGGPGFRAFYRVIESAPLDIYLISAIIVTSILTCILCSCCCQNCVTLLAGHTARHLVPGVAPRCLSAEEKARLPMSPYSREEAEQNDPFHLEECSICLAEFEAGEMVRRLPCGHTLHRACVDAWLEMSTLCPLCKADMRESLASQAANRGAGAQGARGRARGRGSGALGLGLGRFWVWDRRGGGHGGQQGVEPRAAEVVQVEMVERGEEVKEEQPPQ